MKGTLLNSTNYNGKSYSLGDLTGIIGQDMGDNWYGGRIAAFGKTNDGIYLCLDRHNVVVDLFIPEI